MQVKKMKNSKKVFILTESVLGILVIILAVVMLMGRNGKELHKVSVIVENSDDNQWAAFRYGLRMAAEDQEMEISVVSTRRAGGTIGKAVHCPPGGNMIQ